VMSQRISFSQEVSSLARELGVGLRTDPVDGILNYCDRRINVLLDEYGECNSLSELLDWVANKVGTKFVTIKSDEEIEALEREYLRRNEWGFLNLAQELAGENDFGITIRLQNNEEWELQFVSIIDCRGDKASRAYFTKWHEIAHILTLTDQSEAIFRRSHESASGNEPKERLMDIIAGRIGFYPTITCKFIDGDISFETIGALRRQLCPEASFQSSLISFARFWPKPCILLRAGMGLKKDEEALANQQTFFFSDGPKPALRVIQVTRSHAARETGFFVPPRHRIPERSVISEVFSQHVPYKEAEECLSWWESSGGRRLDPCSVSVKAKRSGDCVHALIVPR
jgi:hypothetical protein